MCVCVWVCGCVCVLFEGGLKERCQVCDGHFNRAEAVPKSRFWRVLKSDPVMVMMLMMMMIIIILSVFGSL